MMDPRHLCQLAEIIDLGSLSLAARSLHVSQPTLSRNIKSLEARVGAPVIQRGRYGVRPTSIGIALAREGRSIRDGLRKADLEVSHWKGGLEGCLRIGVGTMLAHSVVPRFLGAMGQRGWNVALRIHVDGADRLIDRVRSDELDVAVVEVNPSLSKEGLARIALFEDRRAYYVGERHPLARRKTVSMAGLGQWIHITVGAFWDDVALDGPAGCRGEGPQIELAGDVAIALHLLSTGAYIARLPEFVMANLCDERRFVRLPYAGKMQRRTFSIWYRGDSAGHPLIKSFCQRFGGFVTDLHEQYRDQLTGPVSDRRM